MGLNADRTGPNDLWILRSPYEDETDTDDDYFDALGFAEWRDRQKALQTQTAR